MKKILKYGLLIFIIVVFCSIFNHKHNFNINVYEATYSQYGYIEHICECGYAYKDHYVNPLNVDDSLNLYNRHEEEERFKRKLIYNIFKNEETISLMQNNCITNMNYIHIPILIKEKVYIVFSRFRGLI